MKKFLSKLHTQLKQISQKQWRIILIISLVSCVAFFFAYHLYFFGKANIQLSQEDTIHIQAKVCQQIENFTPVLNNFTDNQCHIAQWQDTLTFVAGYPNCEFPDDKEHFLEVATTNTFENILTTTTTTNPFTIIQNLPTAPQYFYRVRTRDPNKPNFYTSWSEPKSCTNNISSKTPTLITGVLPTQTPSAADNQALQNQPPTLYNRHTVFDNQCQKPKKNNKEYYDLSPNHWGYNLIQQYTNHNIVSGYSDNTFRPNQPIIRAEAIKIILHIPCKPLVYKSRFQIFSDTPLNQWYSDYVWTGTLLRIVKGYSNTTLFKPTNHTTRAEALKMIINALLPPQETHLSIYSTQKPKFKDIPQNEWFTHYINFATTHNIIEGYENNEFKPHQTITRTEFIKILNHTISYNWNTPFLPQN